MAGEHVGSAVKAINCTGVSAVIALALLVQLASPVAGAEGSNGVARLRSPISRPSCCDLSSSAAPAVIGLPAVAGGSDAYTVGMVAPLSCSQGTWSGSTPLSYTYRWLRNGMLIPGATEATYSLQIIEEATTVACEVTASNQAGSSVALSVSTRLSVLPDERGQVQHGVKVCGTLAPLGDSSAATRAALLDGLMCSEKKRTLSVREAGGLRFEFATPESGTVAAAWYSRAPAKGGRATTRPTLVAIGRASCPGAHGLASVHFTAKLTAQGKILLRNTSRLHLFAKATFTPTSGTPVTVAKHVTIRA
jgi:hypothetical protein